MSKSMRHDDVGGEGKRLSTDAYIDQLKATIRDHGWAVQGVFATETSDQRFDFAYTVGLIEKGFSAELLMSGIPMRTAATILNQIAAEMNSNGETIPPSEFKIPGGYVLKAVTFIPRQGSELHLGVARVYYNRADVPVVQYVWPDKQHHYPWDPQWDPTMLQPYGPNA